MNVKELIEELKKLPEDIIVMADCSSDYEEHTEATRIVKGKAGYSMVGEWFVKSDADFNAIEIW